MDENAFILGIDEAGRGPVIGPMVYATAFCRMKDKDLIKETFKVDDSKQLSDKERERIFEKMKKSSNTIWHIVDIITPNDLSTKMLRKEKYNLNLISHDCAIHLIERAIKQIEEELNGFLKEVYVDTIGDPKKYQKKLEDKFPHLDISVAKKADALYPIVSAASIVAKVTRDALLHGYNVKSMGSGYPSDGVTKKWLQDNKDDVFGYSHEFVRFSWKTIKDILKDPVNIEWSDDEEEDESQMKIFNFVKKTKRRSKFFEDHDMEIVQNFS